MGEKYFRMPDSKVICVRKAHVNMKRVLDRSAEALVRGDQRQRRRRRRKRRNRRTGRWKNRGPCGARASICDQRGKSTLRATLASASSAVSFSRRGIIGVFWEAHVAYRQSWRKVTKRGLRNYFSLRERNCGTRARARERTRKENKKKESRRR